MEIEEKKVLNKQDYAIMQSLTVLYGMYEESGNTLLKESIRVNAVSIRQKAEYRCKYSVTNECGTYLDNYEYKGKYQNNAGDYGYLTNIKIDTEYITKGGIWIHGGKAQTQAQKNFEGLKTIYTNLGVLKARSIPSFIRELVVPDDP